MFACYLLICISYLFLIVLIKLKVNLPSNYDVDKSANK